MADFGINWSGIEQPNILGSYLKGQQFRQEHDNMLYDRKRQARTDARQDKEWASKDQAEQRRKDVLGAYNRGDTAGAQAQAYQAGDTDLIGTLSTLDKSKREQASARAESLGKLAFGIKNLPPEQRRAAIQAAAPNLTALGFTPEQLNSFEPSDGALDGLISSAMDLKDQISRLDKEADNKRADAQLGETRRHNQSTEGISRGNLGVAQSNSARGWAAHNARLKAGGYGTPGVGGVAIPDDQVEIDP